MTSITGKLRETSPSTYNLPLISIGSKTVGIAILAVIILARSPSLKATAYNS